MTYDRACVHPQEENFILYIDERTKKPRTKTKLLIELPTYMRKKGQRWERGGGERWRLKDVTTFIQQDALSPSSSVGLTFRSICTEK